MTTHNQQEPVIIGLSIGDIPNIRIPLDTEENIEICLEFIEIIRKKAISLRGWIEPPKRVIVESDLMEYGGSP